MRLDPIPVMQPKLPPLEHVSNYLEKMYSNGIYSNHGPLVKMLEKRYADYFNVDADLVVLSSSATQALEGAVKLSPAETFYVPAFTFPAPALSVINSGKETSFLDVDALNWHLDLEPIGSTKDQGIMYVLPFGSSYIDPKVYQFENVIIDAAASIGNIDLVLSDLPKSWVVVFSLHVTKVLGVGEGGISIFGNSAAANQFRAWINFGFSGNRNSNSNGTNAKMSEITASFGLSALDLVEVEFEEWNQSRKLVNKIEDATDLKSFSRNLDGHNPYWIVDFESADRKIEAVRKLSDAQIESRDWWSSGAKAMTIFNEFTRDRTFPNTESITGRTLGLPFFRGLTSKQCDAIFNCLN